MLTNLNVSTLLVAFVISISCAFAQATNSQFQSGVVHVKLKEKHGKELKLPAAANQFGISAVDHVLKEVKGKSVKRIFKDAGKFEKAHQHYGLHLWYQIEFDKTVPVADALSKFKNLDQLEVAEGIQKTELIKPIPSTSESQTVAARLSSSTNDPLFAQQWHYENTGQTGGTPGTDIKLNQAWDIETGKPNVIVAILDSKVDDQHPDLAAAMWINTGEIVNNGVDDDNNGYVDDIHGYDFGGATYADSHGTHVAGTVGAVTNNAVGVSGVAGGSGTGNGVRLMSLQIFGESFGAADAMIYAADNGAVISQNSWFGSSPTLEAAIDYFIARAGYDNSNESFDNNIQTGPMAGGIVIFGAANFNTESPYAAYPSRLPQVLSVAATDNKNIKAYFSNYATWVDIAAPGVDVLSTVMEQDGNYAVYSGTSMACPHVSGVAALIISKFGGAGYTPSQVRDRLLYSADDIDFLNPGYEDKLGVGALNAFRALQPEDVIPPDAITTLSINQVNFTTVTLQWTATGESGSIGRAGKYDLRYSLTPINDANFSAATPVQTLPYPKVVGTLQETEIGNLHFNTSYYFAIKAMDMFGNVSDISNIATATTAVEPDVEILPATIDETLFTEQNSVKYASIKNNSPTEIEVSFSFQTTSRPDEAPEGKLFITDLTSSSVLELNPETGDIIGTTPSPKIGLLAFDGKFIYAGKGNEIDQIVPGTGEVMGKFSVDGIILSLTHSGNFLYAGILKDGKGSIVEISFEENRITRSLTTPLNYFNLIATAGSRESLFKVRDEGLGYFAIDETNLITGELIRSLFIQGKDARLITYSDVVGLIFVADYDVEKALPVINAINPDTGSIVYSFPHPSGDYNFGIASDGFSWLTVPAGKTKVSSGQTIQVPLNFNARPFVNGAYTGKVLLKSNFSETPLAEISTTLNVTDAVTGVEDESVIDNISNYPNPFSGKTFITYNLKRTGHVQLTMYDVMGRSISSPVNSYQVSGEHKVEVEGNFWKHGFYYFKLTLDGTVAGGGKMLKR